MVIRAPHLRVVQRRHVLEQAAGPCGSRAGFRSRPARVHGHAAVRFQRRRGNIANLDCCDDRVSAAGKKAARGLRRRTSWNVAKA